MKCVIYPHLYLFIYYVIKKGNNGDHISLAEFGP